MLEEATRRLERCGVFSALKRADRVAEFIRERGAMSPSDDNARWLLAGIA